MRLECARGPAGEGWCEGPTLGAERGTQNAKSLCGYEGRIVCRQTLFTATALQ